MTAVMAAARNAAPEDAPIALDLATVSFFSVLHAKRVFFDLRYRSIKVNGR
jgi:hypothetical protein